MILVDANVFMYAAGTAHPHKQPSTAFLRRVAQGELDAVVVATDNGLLVDVCSRDTGGAG